MVNGQWSLAGGDNQGQSCQVPGTFKQHRPTLPGKKESPAQVPFYRICTHPRGRQLASAELHLVPPVLDSSNAGQRQGPAVDISHLLALNKSTSHIIQILSKNKNNGIKPRQLSQNTFASSGSPLHCLCIAMTTSPLRPGCPAHLISLICNISSSSAQEENVGLP